MLARSDNMKDCGMLATRTRTRKRCTLRSLLKVSNNFASVKTRFGRMGSCSSVPKPDYEVIVKTGDVKGADTDAKVYCCLVDEVGKRSKEFLLDCCWTNDFEKGNIDKFKLWNGAPLGPLKTIEVWRDEISVGDDWYVEWIRIRRLPGDDADEGEPFPCNRWVKIGGKRFALTKYDCMLPQFDDHPEQRKLELEEMRQSYIPSRKLPGCPKQVKSLPREESFSNDYKWNISLTAGEVLIKSKLAQLTSDPWEELEDLSNIHTDSLGKPYGIYNWKEDVAFGRQRLQGCNPVMIRLCKEIPDNFKVTSEMVEPFLDGLNLENAIQAKRMYICNMKVLSDITCRFNRLICKPMALFFVNDSKELMPIAIQLFQNQDEDNPVFLPSDPQHTWMLAKMYYNNADAAYHESCTHLGFTHLVAESLCVGTHRELSPSHPVYRLLAPHFLYLLAINSRALTSLLEPDGWIDTDMTTGVEGLLQLLGLSWKKWRMNVDGWLPTELADRGVEDTQVLPYYPYRDDALLTHQAIWDYVREVIEAHYDSPEKLTDDYEIQNWGRMLADKDNPDGLGILGVFGDGKFTDREDLIRTVTSIIFISSVGHAAANFNQYDEYGFPPHYPAFLRGKPPTSKDELTENDIIDHLPLKDMTIDIILITKILSDRGTNRLGDFEVQYQYDQIGVRAVERFRQRLAEIDKILEEKNKKRAFPYPYLNPREVPNAISI